MGHKHRWVNKHTESGQFFAVCRECGKVGSLESQNSHVVYKRVNVRPLARMASKR